MFQYQFLNYVLNITFQYVSMEMQSYCPLCLESCSDTCILTSYGTLNKRKVWLNGSTLDPITQSVQFSVDRNRGVPVKQLTVLPVKHRQR